MTILITGGAGFIGTNLSLRLLSEGHRVLVLDNLYTGQRDNLDMLGKNPRFRFIEGDVINELFIDEHIDEIYNLACPASPKWYQKNPIYTWKVSIFGIVNIIELAKEKRAKILHASTSEVYGDPLEHPQKETYWGRVNTLGPRACYDEGKRAAETYIMDSIRANQGLDVKIVRIFNTYGPYMDADDGRVVSNFINQSLRNEKVTIYGEGTQTRSFQYIDDLVEGMIRLMKKEKGFSGPVNIGNPEEFTVLELANKVREIDGNNLEPIYKDLPGDDPIKRKPDIGLAKKELNWEPKIALDEGLRKTIEYFKQKM